MNDSVDDHRLRNSTLDRTVHAVENSMDQYGITRPLTTECKSYLNNLPRTPESRKDEILRQINCSKFPRSVHEIPLKLTDFYVYSHMGRSLESVPIALAVTKSLKALENEFPPPGKRKATITTTTNDSSRRKLSKALEVDERIRKDLQKYSQIGEIRKKLFSMPDYVQNRDRGGVKLPESKLKSPPHHLNLNISKVKGKCSVQFRRRLRRPNYVLLNKVLKTKMGRSVVKQEQKRKKIDDMKRMLNPSGKKLNTIF
ncbi:hypothetical protein HA402_009400 [Bradysia odoriphaga]|nr:hypothetical protein HA402_009400 [Bradysia odoriphaga]